MMQKIKQAYNRKSVTSRILILVLINLIIVVAIINMTLFIQLDSIKDSQIETTSNFFDQYNKFALGQAAEQGKQLLLSVMDSRLIYVNLIRSFVFKHGEEHKFTNQPCVILNANTTYSESKTGCYFTMQQNSIFNRHTFENLQKIIEATWMLEVNSAAKRVKRVNIILQNRDNFGDIMVRTIPRDPDFIIGDVADILRSMWNRRSDIVTLSTPYKDTRSRSNPNLTLISLRSKTIFLTPEKNYTMLIELQLFERFFNIPLTRVLLSNQVNIALLRVDSSLPSGYEFIAGYSPTNDYVNYTDLLTQGYKQITIPNERTLHVYTEPLSSAYIAGQFNGNSKSILNRDYCYVITSPSVSFKMKLAVDSFIHNLFSQNLQYLIVWSSILLIIIFTLTLFTTSEIKQCLIFCRKALYTYLHREEKYETVVKNLYLYSFRWQPFTFVLRTVARIIREIESKKVQSRKIKIQNQRYPLNMLEERFVDKNLKFDQAQLIQWYHLIKNKSEQNKSKSLKNQTN